jgi:hypothetical protein
MEFELNRTYACKVSCTAIVLGQEEEPFFEVEPHTPATLLAERKTYALVTRVFFCQEKFIRIAFPLFGESGFEANSAWVQLDKQE